MTDLNENLEREGDDFEGAFEEKDETDGKGKEGTDDTGRTSEGHEEETPEGEVQKEVVEPGKKPDEGAVDWKAKAEAAEKRVADNQAAFTKSQQELASERKQREELQAQIDAAKKPAETAEPELPDEVKSFFNDFPEAKTAIEHLADSLAAKRVKEALGGVDLTQLRTAQEQNAVASWERQVVNGYFDESGNYVEGVPDYYRIAAPGNKEYWDWYHGKGYGPCSPPEAVTRLKEWKTEKEVGRITVETAEKDRLAKEKADNLKKVTSGGLPASQRRPAAAPAADENDFEGGFDED